MFKGLKLQINKFLYNSVSSAGFWSWVLPEEWTKAHLIKQYTRVVYSIVNAIAQNAAKVNFNVMRGDKPLENHDFLTLMRKPNPMMSQFQFLELHFTYMKLTGEAYWYIASGQRSGTPRELYLLPPDAMQVVIDKNDPRGLVKGYQLTKKDGKKIPFDIDEVLHFKMPNPHNPYYGMGPVQAGKVYIETEDYSSDWTKNALYNSGRPSGIVNLKGVVDESTFKQLKRQFKDEYSGTKNAGKTLLLKGMDGIDFQKLGMELGDIALKEMKDMSKEDIMFMFRISKTMMGISDDVNRANAQENHAVFTENIIIPELDRFIDHLNAFFIPRFGNKNDTIGYVDMDLRSDKEKLEEWTQGHNKWLTTNDIRKERGLEPIDGGDVIYVGIGLVPMTKESEEPKEPVEPDDEPEDDEPEDDELEDKTLKKKDLQRRKELFHELIILHQDRWVDQYEEYMVQEFELQQKEIIQNNTGKSKDKTYDKKAFENWLFDVKVAKQRLGGMLIPFGVEILRQSALLAMDLTDDEDTEFVINEEIIKYINQRFDRFADATNDQTIKNIESTIAEGVAAGESVTKLKKRIREVYKEATDIRAKRIARTEALAASNEGANEAYRQSPLVNAKEWMANPGACEICQAINGKVVGLDEDYFKNGQTVEGVEGGKLKLNYENVAHPPVHPNCRCTIVPVIR